MNIKCLSDDKTSKQTKRSSNLYLQTTPALTMGIKVDKVFLTLG